MSEFSLYHFRAFLYWPRLFFRHPTYVPQNGDHSQKQLYSQREIRGLYVP